MSGQVRGPVQSISMLSDNSLETIKCTHQSTVPERVLSIELKLCSELEELTFCDPVAYIYNPLQYAFDVHSKFVYKFCKNKKATLFLGMNPGPWGMSQTGVPFGEVNIVRDWLNLSGTIGRPVCENPSRPILGFDCKRSEVSGRKFWELFKEICGNPDTFFQNCFVYNYCPLAFLTKTGRNITPSELKIVDRKLVHRFCDQALYEIVHLLEPTKIIGIGKYAEKRADLAVKTLKLKNVKVGYIPHPSPRNFGAGDWKENTIKHLQALDLMQLFG